MSQEDNIPQKPKSQFATSVGTEMFEYTGRFDSLEFDRLLAFACYVRASDVTVQPGIPVMAEIAGKWRRITRSSLNGNEVQGIVRAVYNDNGPAALSTGRDLDFAYEIRNPMRDTETMTWEKGYELQPTRLRFRTNITAGREPNGGEGASLTMRTLPAQPPEIYRMEDEPEDLTRLGVEGTILDNWRAKSGLNMVCGTTGSGKSTLLSALVRWRCEQPEANEKVIEYSSPIEYVYDGLDFPSSFVWQTGAGLHLINHDDRGEGGIWSHCIRNALRRKPSTIIIGESRDRHTIEGCIQASLSGHLTISSLHTIGVPESFRRLVSPFMPMERPTISIDLLQVLNIIITQMLLYRIGGGKVAVREFLVFDSGVRRALEDVSSDEWPRLLRKMLSTGKTPKGHPVICQSMDKSAKNLYEKGIISYDDMMFAVNRVESEEE